MAYFNFKEKNQAIMASLLSQMIWANDRIGVYSIMTKWHHFFPFFRFLKRNKCFVSFSSISLSTLMWRNSSKNASKLPNLLMAPKRLAFWVKLIFFQIYFNFRSILPLKMYEQFWMQLQGIRGRRHSNKWELEAYYKSLLKNKVNNLSFPFF